MEAIIANFRGRPGSQYNNHMILKVDGITNKEQAASLVGKTAIWQSPGKNKKQIKGEVRSPHGNKGAVRVIFEKGMPGQSLGEKVNIS